MALSHVEPGSLLLLVPVGDDVAQGLVVDIPGQVHGRQCKHLLHLGRHRESRGPSLCFGAVLWSSAFSGPNPKLRVNVFLLSDSGQTGGTGGAPEGAMSQRVQRGHRDTLSSLCRPPPGPLHTQLSQLGTPSSLSDSTSSGP